jgi:hypothetical protein
MTQFPGSYGCKIGSPLQAERISNPKRLDPRKIIRRYRSLHQGQPSPTAEAAQTSLPATS